MSKRPFQTKCETARYSSFSIWFCSSAGLVESRSDQAFQILRFFFLDTRNINEWMGEQKIRINARNGSEFWQIGRTTRRDSCKWCSVFWHTIYTYLIAAEMRKQTIFWRTLKTRVEAHSTGTLTCPVFTAISFSLLLHSVELLLFGLCFKQRPIARPTASSK